MSSEYNNFPEVDLHKILQKEPNRFLVVTAAAKRARQIKEGARPLIPVNLSEPLNHVQIALKEIEEGKIDIGLSEGTDAEADYLKELDASLEEELKLQEAAAESEKAEKKAAKDKGKKNKSLSA